MKNERPAAKRAAAFAMALGVGGCAPSGAHHAEGPGPDPGISFLYTRAQIEELNPVSVTDLLRRVPGLRLPGRRDSGSVSTTRRVRIEECEEALIFQDGMRISSQQLDGAIRPQHVERIEVYLTPGQIPVQYNSPGSLCGVVVIQTGVTASKGSS